jgi:endogenous inhibitor of DNA gyrase (YacG/DUF329 family)
MKSVDPAANDNLAPGKPCAICGQPAQLRYKPFCSKRCADVDLNRWLTGKYAIPVEEGRDRPDEPEQS